MKTKTILVALCLITSYATSVADANASAYQLNDTTTVFFTPIFIDAAYGSFGIPLAADHTTTYNDRVDVLGYTLTNEAGETPVIDHVSDIVLSNTPIVDTRYNVATGTTATFTLMSIVTFAEPINGDIYSTVAKLPFWVDGQRTTVHENQLADIAPITLTQ